MKKYVMGTVVVAVMVAIVAALGVMRLLDHNGAAPAGRELAAGSAAPVTGRPSCPEGPIAGVDLPCLGGESNAATREVQIVTVWAWWCEPCRAELPYFQKVARRHARWNVVGVHADPNAANGAALLKDLGVDLPSYQDSDNTFAGTLGLPGVIPITLVVVDGQVKGRFIKPFGSVEELEKAIRGVLG